MIVSDKNIFAANILFYNIYCEVIAKRKCNQPNMPNRSNVPGYAFYNADVNTNFHETADFSTKVKPVY